MSDRDVVVQSADSLHLLGSRGELEHLDSMAMMDLAIEIETRTGLKIPVSQIRQDTFESVDAITKMIETLRA